MVEGEVAVSRGCVCRAVPIKVRNIHTISPPFAPRPPKNPRFCGNTQRSPPGNWRGCSRPSCTVSALRCGCGAGLLSLERARVAARSLSPTTKLEQWFKKSQPRPALAPAPAPAPDAVSMLVRNGCQCAALQLISNIWGNVMSDALNGCSRCVVSMSGCALHLING